MSTTTKAITIILIVWTVIIGAATLYTGVKAMKSLRQMSSIDAMIEIDKK